MFTKLYRKIYLPIVLIAVTLIVFINVFAAAMLTTTLRDTHNDIGQERIERALDSCKLYVSSVAATTNNLSLDSDIINELSAPKGTPLIDKLDNACNYSLKIDAVCVYSVNGNVYTSSKVAQVPTIDELKKVAVIKEFMESDEDATISLRTEVIADIYNNVSYPEEMGVVTCCRKIFNDGEVVGWIFSDILPSNLYNYLFPNGEFENTVAFITAGDIYFEYADNANHESLLSGKSSGYFKYNAVSEDGLFALTVFNSAQEYSTQITILIVISSAISIALIVGVHFAAKKTAKSVVKRLQNLADKMNSQDIP